MEDRESTTVDSKAAAAEPRGQATPVAKNARGTHQDLLSQTHAETKNKGVGFPVTGIGASAGGREAIAKFFAAMPQDSGMAFVVIPVRGPTDADPFTVKGLASCTGMEVVHCTEPMPIQENRVYLAVPDQPVAVSSGMLCPTTRGGGTVVRSTAFSVPWPSRCAARARASFCPEQERRVAPASRRSSVRAV